MKSAPDMVLDFRPDVFLPSQMKRCANVITEEKFRAVDVGKFQENSYFVYVAAFGAFTEVSWNTPQKTKNALGHNAYILEGIRQVGTFPLQSHLHSASSVTEGRGCTHSR